MIFSFKHEPDTKATDSLAEFLSFDIRSVPAWGLFAKNIKELCLDNVRFHGPENDKRSAVVAERIAKFSRRDVRIALPVRDSYLKLDEDVKVLRWP